MELEPGLCHLRCWQDNAWDTVDKSLEQSPYLVETYAELLKGEIIWYMRYASK